MKRFPVALVLLVVIIIVSSKPTNCDPVPKSFDLHFKATTFLEVTDSHKRHGRPSTDLSVKNATRSVHNQTSSDNFYELNNKMLPSAKLTRAKRQTRVIVDRPRSRNLGRRRPPPPFLPPRLPPIARRRFPKRPGKLKFHHKPPPPKGSHRPQYGPPVGFFVMNLNNEIVHKSKDLGDIPPQYLDKIIPPNFISDSPPKIYALEHDEGPPLGLGESKEVSYTPTNSYGSPLDAHQLDPQQYYPYPPESNNVPQQSETRPQIDSYNHNRGQSETRYNQEQQYQPAPVVYHPPYKPKNKNKKKKKKNPQQLHQEIALQPDSGKNTYPVSSYDVPLNYVPATASSSGENYPVLPPQKAARPVFNVGQSFVESYTRDSNEHPPQLPAVYNQNDFKTVNKSSNKKKVVYQVNTSYEDFDDNNDDGSYNGDEDHGLALEYPPSSGEEQTEAPASNFGERHRRPPGHSKRRPPKFDFIDSYEDSSISQEVYHTTPFTITRPFKKATTSKGTTTTTRNYLRTRSTTKDPLFEILDTEDLRNAFQSGRHRYKLQAAKKNQQNFVLLSSKNPTYQRATSKSPPSVTSSRESEEDWSSSKSKPNFDRPPSSLETDYESYELAEQDFGLRKRDFTHKRKGARVKDEVLARKDTSVEKIQFSDAKRPPDEFVKATTMKPYPRFNPDVQFTKTFSSKIEQPREHQTAVGLWNGHPIPGNHKIAKRGGGGGSSS